MNANELADELDWVCENHLVGIGNADFKAIATMLRKQQEEIEYWKEKFNKAMEIQEVKPAKYSEAWWKEVEEFNKKLRTQDK
jgi:hypothetical protein